MKDKTIYILDSYGLIYRSYYAFINRPLVNEQGENVSAVFGFFRNLFSAIQTYNIQYAAAAFDSRVKTFRHDMYSEYKATRQKTPEDLHAQVPIIEEILTALGIPVLRNDGFEADDIIATLCRHCLDENRPCKILSGDKDLMQLVSDTTTILKPDKGGGWMEVDGNGVKEEWGVGPELMLDLLSLTGDSSDNVPGISGIGDKSALKLLTQYGNLDGILSHADEITGAMGKKIQEGKESALFSKSLIALRYDVPVTQKLEDYSAASLDYASAARLLFRYGVPAVAKQYAKLSGDPELAKQAGVEGVVTKKEAAEIPLFTSQTDISYPEDDDNISLKKNEGVYKGITKLSELKELIDSIVDSSRPEKIAAFDCETDSLDTMNSQLAGFSLSMQSGTGFYIPLVTQDSLMSGSLIVKKDAIKELERLFYNNDVKLIMHNGKFDYEVLRSNGMTKPFSCLIIDTMTAAWLLSPDRSSFALEALSEAKLGLSTTSFSDIVPKGKTFIDVPLDQAIQYASEDADLTWQLWQIFKPKLEKNNLLNLFCTLEMPVLPILAEMEIQGIHIEENELNEYAVELSGHIASIQTDIYSLVGHEFNIASTKQLQEVLFVERKLPSSKKTKTGYSTDTSVLEELASLDPVPAKILQFRQLSKLLSTYVETLPKLADSNGRIHTSFIQTGTATGRLSSRDPNLQNIPVRDEEGRRIRMAFTPENGYNLVSADYSQIELVLLAHLSQDENLCKAFNEGQDVHKATASLIFNADPDHVTSDMRRTAKTINFGVMYGMSAFRLSNELGIPRTRAAQFIESYFTTYSGIQSFIQKTVMFAEQNGFVETIMGRRRYIQTINSKNKTEKSGAERIAVNTPIQGSAADIVKKAMLSVHAALKKNYPAARLLLQVHDELIIECREEDTKAVCDLVKKEMEGVITLSVPLKVSVESGKRWGDFH